MAREHPWLSLWESWHAEGVTERVYFQQNTLSAPFGGTSPKGRGKFGAVQYCKINYNLKQCRSAGFYGCNQD